MAAYPKPGATMNGVAVLRACFGQAHNILEAAIADCDAATLHHFSSGSKIGTIASIYVHTLFDEDMMINSLLRGKATIFQSDGWSAKVGFEMPSPQASLDWSARLRVNDLAAVRAYAAAVYGQTDAFLAGLGDADLDREIDFFGQKQPMGQFLAGILQWHAISHQGEISALKGVLGQTGLPF
jgi:hypothetical protein